MARSKYFQRFTSRLNYFTDDIELVDVIREYSKATSHATPGGQVFDYIDYQKHPQLSKRKATIQARRLAVGHLRNTIHYSFLKDLYEDATLYFKDIINEAAHVGLSGDRLIGEHKIQFTANQILEAGGWEEVLRLVSDSVFRNLENEKSTPKLISKLCKKLGIINIKNLIDDAMPYFELRHLLVHNDGKYDAKFISNYPSFNGAKVNGKIDLSIQTINDARNKTTTLLNNIDDQLISLKRIRDKMVQP